MVHTPPGTTTDEHGRPLDQIRLVGISQRGHHGVLDHERRGGQEFLADVTVHLDTRRAAASDDLTLTLNYGVLSEQIAAVLAGPAMNLIETVAEQIASVVLDYAIVGAVDVALHKPQAPIEVPFDDVVVAIRRDRVKLPAARFDPDATPAAALSSIEPRRAPAPGGEPLRAAPQPVAAPEPHPETTDRAEPAGHGMDPREASTEPHEPAADSAPVPVPDRLDTAPQGLVRVVIALGSNLGDAKHNLRSAIGALVDAQPVEVRAVAPLARTAPVGGPDQEDYLNTVVIVETTLSPRALLRLTQSIENNHGRVRDVRWGPRTLDIDLIDYDGIVAVADDLELPHPRAHERAFVLQPWAQIEPGAHLPGLGGGPVDALAATAPDAAGVRWLALDWLNEPGPQAPPTDPQPAQPGPIGEGPAPIARIPGPQGPAPIPPL